MKTLLLTLILLTGGLVASPAAATTMQINATQDAMGDKFEPDRYPFNTYFLWLRGTHFFTQSRFGVKFDELSAAPPVEQVSRVLLQLRHYGGFGHGRIRIRVTPAEDEWTAEDFPQRGPGVNLNSPYVEAVMEQGAQTWVSFDVTETVKDWLRHPESNRGFSVSAQPADLGNPDVDPTSWEENDYSIAFESTDSRWPEGSEQFGLDLPPGHPPRLKIDYQPTAKIQTSKKQVKGITTGESSWFASLGDFFSSFLPRLTD